MAQLERMLDARSRVAAGNFLGVLPTIEPMPPAPGSDWDEGSRIGAYRLVRHIGSGGMAEVWLAARVDGAFERKVAIKLLHSHPARAQREALAERFKRERTILASLDHPNIARLSDAGVTAAGQPWLALEYVQGEAIRPWCDGKRLAVAQRVGVFAQVLRAVEYAHASLVMHRDLKPSNILVTDDGSVKLLDFGIAKLLESSNQASANTDLTRQSGRPLTLQYASPEQLLDQPLTTASDVYSLGVVLYELLCGRRPYDVKLGFADRVDAGLFDREPPAPSRAAFDDAIAGHRSSSVPALRAALASDLDAIVLKALAVSPKDRYPSVEALRDDLERWQNGLPVRAKPSTAAYRLGKFLKRNALTVSLGSGVGLALAIAAAVSLAMSWKASQEADRAIAARDFMIAMFRVADPDKLQGSGPAARQMLETASERAAVDLRGQPELLATVLESIGVAQVNQGMLTVAEMTYSRLAGLYVGQNHKREWIFAQARLANVVYRVGDFARASDLIDRAVQASTPFHDDHDLQAEVLWTRGWIERILRKLPAAELDMRQALVHSKAAHGATAFRTLEAVKGLVDVEGELRQFDKALAVVDESIAAIAADTSVAPIPRMGMSIARVHLLMKAGRYAESLRTSEALASQCERIAGADHIDCVLLLNIRALMFARLEMRDESLSMVGGLVKGSLDSSSPRQSIANLLNLGRVVAAARVWSSYPDVRERIAAVAADAAANTADRTVALWISAEEALFRGAADEAYKSAQSALELQGASDLPSGLLGRTKLYVGLALQARGDDESAVAALVDAETQLDQELGKDHPLLPFYRLNRAVSLHRLGRDTESAMLVSDALPKLRVAFGIAAPVVQRIDRLRLELPRTKSASHRSGPVRVFS
ncbi:MAG: protein kinase [Caldimonas sp.]